ncbi:CAP domain-containing protein [Alsobacter sp. SYSU M60028]|uniref:CAP domain-containing protein n=1 Tax=Alsobacter ponti TaxID=2962936 RepID=A0ABT1LGG1_9HYPH|nr:CAP domain-containing protein [Alsobacter ponti]MCP8940534.1 CAP domain-containing protein [Alsobacter ponti]
MSFRRAAPVFALACAAALAGCQPEQPRTDAGPAFYQRLDQGATLDQGAAASLLNGWRARNGLAPLRLDPALSAEARQRAAGVAETDTSTWGETPRVQQAASTTARQERVSAGYRTLAEAFSGWRDSPQHNRVMLAPTATRLGIAAVDRPGAKYRVYWALIVAE